MVQGLKQISLSSAVPVKCGEATYLDEGLREGVIEGDVGSSHDRATQILIQALAEGRP